MDRFAEPVIGRAFARVMTTISVIASATKQSIVTARAEIWIASLRSQ
jgi:hypothetical protein